MVPTHIVPPIAGMAAGAGRAQELGDLVGRANGGVLTHGFNQWDPIKADFPHPASRPYLDPSAGLEPELAGMPRRARSSTCNFTGTARPMRCRVNPIRIDRQWEATNRATIPGVAGCFPTRTGGGGLLSRETCRAIRANRGVVGTKNALLVTGRAPFPPPPPPAAGKN